GLMNGDVGIVLPSGDEDGSDRKNLKVVFPMADGALKKVQPSRLTDAETVYAMTVHKSQGSEFDHTVLVFPDRMNPVLTRELIYTAVTRSRGRFTLAAPRMDLMPKSVKRRVHRASGLAALFRPAPEPETAAGRDRNHRNHSNHRKHRNRLQSRDEMKSTAKEFKERKKRRIIQKKEAFKKSKSKKAVQLSLFD
ncbi:MAG: ATP-binding domain-containing protein, partial [Deltaproteobacteria bacterium]|nr:ATP-binding domain-containing protein [Deltaproteobacteria bacterium]